MERSSINELKNTINERRITMDRNNIPYRKMEKIYEDMSDHIQWKAKGHRDGYNWCLEDIGEELFGSKYATHEATQTVVLTYEEWQAIVNKLTRKGTLNE